jgi:single-strand DNA-binding protein
MERNERPVATVNSCIPAGNLTRDPELRHTPKGTAVIGAALAVNRSWKNEAGEKQEEVSFIDFRAFGKTAEIISQYFRKGGNILLQGRLQQERWQDKQSGENRSKVVLVAESFQFLNRNGGEENGQPRPAAPKPEPAAAPAKPTYEPAEPEADDVPF